MARSTKLADLMVKETSGVDHPAHLHEGWLVIKSEDLTTTLDGLTESDTLLKETHVDLQVTETIEPTIEKAADNDEIKKELSDLRKALDDARRETDSIKAVRALEKATEVAHAWAILPELNPVEFAPVLVQVRETMPEAALLIEKVLEASSRAMRESGLLTELGTTSSATDNDAWTVITAQANKMVSDGLAPSFAKAVTTIAEGNKDLYTQYLNEKGL